MEQELLNEEDTTEVSSSMPNNPDGSMLVTSTDEKISRLTQELFAAKQTKKTDMKCHSEEIKRIETEIKELLD